MDQNQKCDPFLFKRNPTPLYRLWASCRDQTASIGFTGDDSLQQTHDQAGGPRHVRGRPSGQMLDRQRER